MSVSGFTPSHSAAQEQFEKLQTALTEVIKTEFRAAEKRLGARIEALEQGRQRSTPDALR